MEASTCPSIVTGPVPVVHASLPETAATGAAMVRVQLESGAVAERPIELAECVVADRAETSAGRFVRLVVPLPEGISTGYHELTVEIPAHRIHAVTRLIVCPSRALEPAWRFGLAAPPGGHQSLWIAVPRNWGCGDITDLKRFDRLGGRAPRRQLHRAEPAARHSESQPYNTSPYLPNSIFYRNPIYLDVEDIPEFAASRRAAGAASSRNAMQKEIAALRERRDWWSTSACSHLKLRFLKLLFRDISATSRRDRQRPRPAEFKRYIEREGDLLHRFAVHSALDEAIHRVPRMSGTGTGWPEQYQDPESPDDHAEFARKHLAQCSVFQIHAVAAPMCSSARAQQHARSSAGLSIGLYHDLALATDRFGSDLWAHREFFVSRLPRGRASRRLSRPKDRIGAFRRPIRTAHVEDGYRLFAESIRKNCRHGGALRIDHVMRFFRLYWIPDGMEATKARTCATASRRCFRFWRWRACAIG